MNGNGYIWSRFTIPEVTSRSEAVSRFLYGSRAGTVAEAADSGGPPVCGLHRAPGWVEKWLGPEVARLTQDRVSVDVPSSDCTWRAALEIWLTRMAQSPTVGDDSAIQSRSVLLGRTVRSMGVRGVVWALKRCCRSLRPVGEHGGSDDAGVGVRAAGAAASAAGRCAEHSDRADR